jgi:predicted MFS family arabinose efflux permease
MSNPSATPASTPVVRATLAVFAATLLGIGLARFAYTPLIPAVIAAGWFSPADTAYLGAANLSGYIAGALLGRPLAARLGTVPVLRLMLLLATATFFASVAPVNFAWFFAWRFGAGFAGAVLMVLAAPSVLPHIPPGKRGLAGGIMFTGVGIGMIASGTLVPILIGRGLAVTWLTLGAMAAVLTALAWTGWPHSAPARAATTSAPRSPRALKALYAVYGLAAVGLVPHMLFLVDSVARGLNQGIAVGARYWVVFGVGAMLGPVTTGVIADRIGFRRALRLGLVVQIAMIGLLAVASDPVSLVASSLVIGAFTPGIAQLVLGRLQELAPDDRLRRSGWTVATIAFALGQAASAYAMSYLFARHPGDYALLFGLGAVAVVAALVIELIAGGDRK